MISSSTRRSTVLAPWLAVVVLAACGETPVTRHGPAAERVVARTWTASPQTIRSTVLDAFLAAGATFPSPFNHMAIHELKPPRYPPEWIGSWVDPGHYLEDYKRLAPEARQDDLLLEEPTGDVYWPSDYATAAGPVRFRCGMLLHFAGTAAGTSVETFEIVPSVWVGEHWGFSAHGVGFGRFHDIRFVEPSTQERIGILDLIDRLLPVSQAR